MSRRWSVLFEAGAGGNEEVDDLVPHPSGIGWTTRGLAASIAGKVRRRKTPRAGGLTDAQLADIDVMLAEDGPARPISLSEKTTRKGEEMSNQNQRWDAWRDRAFEDRFGPRPEDEAGAAHWDLAVKNAIERERQEDERAQREAERAERDAQLEKDVQAKILKNEQEAYEQRVAYEAARRRGAAA